MTQRNAGTVAIKLDLRGQEELKRRLAELGPAGERVFKDLSRAAKPVSTDLNLMKRATDQASDSMRGLAGNAGPVGGFLTAMGPWGLAAAAGMGALALAVREVLVMMERSRETAFWAEELENVERVTSLTTESILGLASAVQLAGGDFDAVLSNLEEMSKRIGEYRNSGSGEAADAFEALGLQDLVDNGADVTIILDEVIARLQQIEDPTRRQSIADKLGLVDAVPLLQQSADEMERLLAAADDLNAGFSSDVLQRFADAGEAIRAAQARQERARQLESLASVDLEVARQEALARMAEARAALSSRHTSTEMRLTEQLELQVEVLERQIERVSSAESHYAQLGVHVADLRREQEAINDILFERSRMDMAIGLDSGAALDAFRLMVAEWGDESETDPGLTAERRRELEALVEQSLRSLMTPLQQITQLESDLREAREAGLEITDQEIARIVHLRREAAGLAGKLAELTDEERKLMGAASDVLDPLEAQKNLLEELQQPIDEARERLATLYALWESTPEHADIIIAEIERVKDALGMGDDDSTVEREDLFPSLAKMAEEAGDLADQLDRGVSDAIQGVADGLGDIITNARSAGDAAEMMRDRIIAALVEIAMQQLVIQPLASLATSFLSNLSLPGISAGVHHTGGEIGAPGGLSRTVPAAMFAGAMRAHTGASFLGPDEFPVIGKRGERMLNPSENSALLTLLDRAAGGQGSAPTVNIIGAQGVSDVKKRQEDGAWIVDVILAQAREAGAQGGVEAFAGLGANMGDLMAQHQLEQG